MNIVSNLHNHDLLLNNDTSNEEKFQAANDIIKFYELPLSNEQILFAFEKMRDHLLTYGTWINKCDINRILFFNEVVNINKNMYVAIILAICNNFILENLVHPIIYGRYYINIGPMNPTICTCYCYLLDYYEFDVSNISTIPNGDKEIIQTYRADKYFGKLTKCAVKNE